jgi:hypothetical protein
LRGRSNRSCDAEYSNDDDASDTGQSRLLHKSPFRLCAGVKYSLFPAS